MRKSALLFLAFSATSFAQTATLQSPNGTISVTISDELNTPTYSINFKNKPIINNSALGFEFKQHAPFSESFKITNTLKKSENTQWQLPWGERKNVVNNYNEVAVTFNKPQPQGGTFTVKFKAFNSGVGFRYEVPKQAGFENVEITKELTEFAINNSQDATAWWIPARGWNRYEYLYKTTALNDAPLVNTPFTFKNKEGVHVSIHEAALVDYAGMALNQRRHGVFQADLTPWSDGTAVKKQGAFNTPWRTIQIGSKAVDLVNSDIILNLNEPNKLGDVSWVKPGKYVGIWWGMHIKTHTWESGEKHGATTQTTKNYMDFAAKYGFDGVLVEGWNIGWDGDWFYNGDVFSFTQPYDDFDIDEVAQYGKQNGVQLIGHHETSGNVSNYHAQMEDAFALYEKSNVSQVKTGYVADGGNIKRIDENGIARHEWHDGQFMVNEYLYNVTLAAKHKISINTHEPVKDTGLRRTYPNWIAREGARGQEFNAWGTPPNPPEHIPMLAFTRMLAGPMDFTPGIFDMSFNGLGENTNRPQTTLAKQLALYVVLYSPIQMAADLPKNYLAKPDAFQFIQDVPTDWQQSIALDGEVGDFIVFARKERKSEKYSGNDWYLGAVTDEKARTIEVKLDFLDKDKQFEAQIYRDGNKAEWKNNPYDLSIEKRTVTANDKLTLKLATSGGTAIRFKAI